ncbi:porin [Rhodocyclaceae bacterium SMB388]
MQKKLIALAIAGMVAAPVAMAQSNVTVYGVVDAAVAAGSQGSEDFTGVVSGILAGSRIGFRGTEDLGNGLKAVFVLEYGLNIDENQGIGTGGLRARQQLVGLSGDWGTVALGRQYAPGYWAGVDFNAVNSANLFDPHPTLAGAAGLSILAASPARWDSAVTYTGSFSGLTVRGIWSARGVEQTTFDDATPPNKLLDPSDDDAYGLGLTYKNGPLAVGVTYHSIQGNAGVTPSTKTSDEWFVGGSYDFGFAKFVASYQDGSDLGNVKGNDADLWYVGAIVPVGAAGKVHVGYGESDQDGNGKLVTDPDYREGKAKSFALAYTHGLSARTTLYAAYNYVSNDDDTSAGFGEKTGKSQNLFGLGVNHRF